MAIVKGQEIWLKHSRQGLIKTEVASVGRKYITLTYDTRVKFDVNTLRQVDYRGNPHYIIDDIEKYNHDRQISNFKERLRTFNWDLLDEDDLYKAIKIINEY